MCIRRSARLYVSLEKKLIRSCPPCETSYGNECSMARIRSLLVRCSQFTLGNLKIRRQILYYDSRVIGTVVKIEGTLLVFFYDWSKLDGRSPSAFSSPISYYDSPLL